MGYFKHHAIIVTGGCGYQEEVRAVRKLAKRLGGSVSKLKYAPINGVVSFCLFPDGSKEEYDESDQGDATRATIVAFLDKNQDLSWEEIQYGDELGDINHHEHCGECKWVSQEFTPNDFPSPGEIAESITKSNPNHAKMHRMISQAISNRDKLWAESFSRTEDE